MLVLRNGVRHYDVDTLFLNFFETKSFHKHTHLIIGICDWDIKVILEVIILVITSLNVLSIKSTHNLLSIGTSIKCSITKTAAVVDLPGINLNTHFSF